MSGGVSTKKISLFLSLMLFVTLIPSVFAMPWFSPQDRYNSADVILTGEILSYTKPDPLSNQVSSIDTIYEVKVDQYIKNPLDKDIISVIARGGPGAELDPMGGSTVNFDTGDYVYLYLDKLDNGMFRVKTIFSYKMETPCEPIPDELAHLTDEPSPWQFQVTDSNRNAKDVFSANEEVVIRYDTTNRETTTQTITYEMTVHDGPNSDDKILYQPPPQEITLPACKGHKIIEWRFTPTEVREYFVQIRDSYDSGLGFGIQVTQTGEKFEEPEIQVPKPILQQLKFGIEKENLVCHGIPQRFLVWKYNGLPACVDLETVFPLIERGWAKKETTDTSSPAFDVAQRFLESSHTFAFDGIKEGSGFSLLSYSDEYPPTYLLQGQFSSEHAGYGDRTGQVLAQMITPHEIIVKVRGPVVLYAVIDNQWDEINQQFIAERLSDFKDYKVRYSKYFGGEERDYHIILDSQAGLLRFTDTPNDTHYLVSYSTFEKLWNVISENDFFELENPNPEPEPLCDGCIAHNLNIESGGAQNDLYWLEEQNMPENLMQVMSELEEIVQNQKDGWPQK
jgi:hypothetical protein